MNAIDPTLNSLEMRDWLEDIGSDGNINFTVISSYRGHITSELLKESVQALASFHPVLRTTFKVHGLIPQFKELNSLSVPLRVDDYRHQDQWREFVRIDLKERFSKDYEPLWRVSFLKRDNEGQILLTFHHAIADAVCAMEVMNHLYKILSAKMQNKTPDIHFNFEFPSLESLYNLLKKETASNGQAAHPEAIATSPSEQRQLSHVNFVKHVIDETMTKQVIRWSKDHDIKINSILFAAYLQAIKAVRKLPFDVMEAFTVVNFRPFFNPPVSKELTRDLFTGLSKEIKVSASSKFIDIARELHEDLHKKLQDGEHVKNLQKLNAKIDRNLSPKEFLEESKAPPNFAAVTNVGIVSFDGSYGCQDLNMEDIYFVPNIGNYFEHPHNSGLAVTTFRNRIFLCLFFPEELFCEEDAKAVLEQLGMNLLNNCR